jgi:hypothetical protein
MLTLKLALLTQISSNSANTPRHVEERLPGSGTAINWLLCGLERGAFGFHSADDLLQIADATSKTIDAC